jgi:hypothetical protein
MEKKKIHTDCPKLGESHRDFRTSQQRARVTGGGDDGGGGECT